MTELRLQQAAACLPAPSCTYAAIQARANRQQAPVPSSRRFRRLCAVCIALFILAGCTTWAATTDASYGAWATHSSSLHDMQYQAKRLELVLPETFAGCPFQDISTAHVVPQDTTFLEALIRPAYRYYTADYDRTELHTSTAHSDPVTHISVSFGSTENELWRYCFEYDTGGIWSPDRLIPESYRAEEYEGRLLQVGTTAHYWEYDGRTTYNHFVHWVEEEQHVCIGISADTDQETLLEYAKQIIDLNQ